MSLRAYSKASLPEEALFYLFYEHFLSKARSNLIEGTCEIAYGEAQKIFAKLRREGAVFSF